MALESRSELPLKVGGLQVSCFAALSSVNTVRPSDPQEKEQGDIAMRRRGLPGRGLGTVARKSEPKLSLDEAQLVFPSVHQHGVCWVPPSLWRELG